MPEGWLLTACDSTDWDREDWPLIRRFTVGDVVPVCAGGSVAP
jgi:hypothetical protein